MLKRGIVENQITAPVFPTIFESSRFLFDAKASETVTISSGSTPATWIDYYNRYTLTRNGTITYLTTGFNTSYPYMNFPANGSFTGAVGAWPTGAANYTIFFVMGTNASRSATQYLMTVNTLSGTSGSTATSLAYRINISAGLSDYWYPTGGSQLTVTVGNSVNAIVCFTASGTSKIGYLNNVQASTLTSTVATNIPSTASLYVGADDLNNSDWAGKLANITLFNSVLSSTDRTTVYNFLKSRYGL